MGPLDEAAFPEASDVRSSVVEREPPGPGLSPGAGWPAPSCRRTDELRVEFGPPVWSAGPRSGLEDGWGGKPDDLPLVPSGPFPDSGFAASAEGVEGPSGPAERRSTGSP